MSHVDLPSSSHLRISSSRGVTWKRVLSLTFTRFELYMLLKDSARCGTMYFKMHFVRRSFSTFLPAKVITETVALLG